jgi:hypothetical protein
MISVSPATSVKCPDIIPPTIKNVGKRINLNVGRRQFLEMVFNNPQVDKSFYIISWLSSTIFVDLSNFRLVGLVDGLLDSLAIKT